MHNSLAAIKHQAEVVPLDHVFRVDFHFPAKLAPPFGVSDKQKGGEVGGQVQERIGVFILYLAEGVSEIGDVFQLLASEMKGQNGDRRQRNRVIPQAKISPLPALLEAAKRQ